MALTDNPYLPFYVKDWQSSNKLRMCSMAAHGLMINIMALLHRENTYGRILLEQKFKQNQSMCLNFASQFACLLPFSYDEIAPALAELLKAERLKIDGDFLYSEKMEKLNYISNLRAEAGKKGGKASKESKNFDKAKGKASAKDFAQAKQQANTATAFDTAIEPDNSLKGTSAKVKIEDIAFLNFWEQYGYKKDKPAAEKAWRKLTEKEKVESVEYIADYIDECTRLDRPLRYPATYLNQKTWENEIEYSKSRKDESLSEKNNRAGAEAAYSMLKDRGMVP